MNIIRFFLLWLSTNVYSEKLALIITYGKPLTFTSSTSFDSWNDCLDACWEDIDCRLIHQVNRDGSRCELYSFGQITTVQKMNESTVGWTRVAFRRNISSECPSSNFSTPPLFNEDLYSENWITGQIIKYWKLSETESTWNFNYQTVICPPSSTPFWRVQGVCVELRLFNTAPYYADREGGVSLCAKDGGMSLTGAYNSEEYNWLLEQVPLKLAQLTGAAARVSTVNSSVFWLDGKCTFEKRYQFDMVDSSHYNPQFNYTYYLTILRGCSGALMCLGMPFDGTVWDNGCTVTIQRINDLRFYFRGAFCRIRPL